MILAREDMVWVRTSEEQLVSFAPCQLVASICQAAPRGADEPAQLVAESISRAIHQFACEHAPDQRIGAGEIGDMVEALLEMLGHDEWCLAYSLQRRQTQIQLDQMVAGAGVACELSFFQGLDAALRRAAAGERRRLQMTGLRRCVLRLRGTQRWTRSCRQLADEIVGYVWARAERLPARDSSLLQLAVVD